MNKKNAFFAIVPLQENTVFKTGNNDTNVLLVAGTFLVEEK